MHMTCMLFRQSWRDTSQQQQQRGRRPTDGLTASCPRTCPGRAGRPSGHALRRRRRCPRRIGHQRLTGRSPQHRHQEKEPQGGGGFNVQGLCMYVCAWQGRNMSRISQPILASYLSDTPKLKFTRGAEILCFSNRIKRSALTVTP